MSNKERFRETYRAALADAVRNHPAEYPWAAAPTVIVGNLGTTTLPTKIVESVAERMCDAIENNSASIDGRAFKATCKTLGIKHTRKAIREYWNG